MSLITFFIVWLRSRVSSVGLQVRPSRSKNLTPSSFSSSPIAFDTAPGVTKRAFAAEAKLPVSSVVEI